MTNIIFRHYRKGDETQLVNLFNLAFKRKVIERNPTNWRWRYAESPGFESKMVQIAEDVEIKKIIGAIYVNLIERIPIGQKEYLIGEINDVTTHPSYSKKGIATKLMEKSIEYMKEKGCDFSILSTGRRNFARSKLYQKFGYFNIENVNLFVQVSNAWQLIRDNWGYSIFFPIFTILSYFPRFLNKLRIKFKHKLEIFSYEIVHNKKHFEFMKTTNKISPNVYDGFPKYDKIKFNWARINTSTNNQKPTYIFIKKVEKIIGGAIITHQNLQSKKSKFRIRLGIIHEIFLNSEVFNNIYDLFLGYIYLIDKVVQAGTHRRLTALLFESSFKNEILNQAFKGMCFFKIKNDVIMVKELKEGLKFPKLRKPLYIPTYISLGL
jgi:GNAT superfamily N-acetyltransferase